MENAAAFPTIQPLDYDYEKQDTTACPIWLEKNVSTNLDKISSKRVTLAAITADMRVAGIIGAIPQYGVTGWELHPLAVLKEYQRQGIGAALVEALESEVYARGGVMIYLGSDDESGTTSLYGVDLYDDHVPRI